MCIKYDSHCLRVKNLVATSRIQTELTKWPLFYLFQGWCPEVNLMQVKFCYLV